MRQATDSLSAQHQVFCERMGIEGRPREEANNSDQPRQSRENPVRAVSMARKRIVSSLEEEQLSGEERDFRGRKLLKELNEQRMIILRELMGDRRISDLELRRFMTFGADGFSSLIFMENPEGLMPPIGSGELESERPDFLFFAEDRATRAERERIFDVTYKYKAHVITENRIAAIRTAYLAAVLKNSTTPREMPSICGDVLSQRLREQSVFWAAKYQGATLVQLPREWTDDISDQQIEDLKRRGNNAFDRDPTINPNATPKEPNTPDGIPKPLYRQHQAAIFLLVLKESGHPRKLASAILNEGYLKVLTRDRSTTPEKSRGKQA